MKKNTCLLLNGFQRAFRLGLFLIVLNLFELPILAEPDGKNEIPKEREIHNTFSDSQKKGTFLDATNPMDLMNRLRSATSMDEATSPSDAIDDALNAFYEAEEEVFAP